MTATEPPVRPEEDDAPAQRTLTEIMDDPTLEPVAFEDGVLIVVQTPRSFVEPPGDKQFFDPMTVGAEFGTTRSAFSSFAREEYNSKLRGHQGLQIYDQMRRNDAVVRSALEAVKTPITGAEYFIHPAEEKPQAKMQAEFVDLTLNDWMTYPWPIVLDEALLQFDFGYYMFEKVWDVREWKGERRIWLRKLAARHPMDVPEGGWRFDGNGGPRGVWLYQTPEHPDAVFIPIDKLCVFTHDLESGDITGRSVLRAAYKHWYYQENSYKIDGIQKERHGVGVPVIKLPMGFTPADKTAAHELGRNLRSNEKAHIVLPPNWEVEFAKVEGQPVSALETARHHGEMIYRTVMAQAVWSTAQGTVEPMMELFYKSVRRHANRMAGIMNRYVIPEIIDMNWGKQDKYPKMFVRKLGDVTEARTISFAVRNLVGSGVIQPDDRLELWARELVDAPPPDPATKRVVAQPQNPFMEQEQHEGRQPGGGNGPKPITPGGVARPPRQSQAANQRGAGSANAGRDGGGEGGGR